MRRASAVVVAAVSGAIVAAGYIASPKELPTLELVAPANQSAETDATSSGSASEEPNP